MYRHPELHQNPEVIAMPRQKNTDRASIELGQHTDGRWMWATSCCEDYKYRGYCCGAKWGNFAPTRDAALRCAVEEILAITKHAVADWAAQQLEHQQLDLFGGAA